MWQQSHGRWPSLMRRTVCLTNYPGGQTACFSNAIFFRPLSHTHSGFFSPQFLSTRTEPWHVMRIFAFELALLITAYWSPFPTEFHCLFWGVLLTFIEPFLIRGISNFSVFPLGFPNCSLPLSQVTEERNNAQNIVWHEIHNLQSGSKNS